MACIEALYRRLKSLCRLKKGRCADDDDAKDNKEIVIYVNPYAPIDESAVKLTEESDKTNGKSRKVLRFESVSKESSAEHVLSVSLQQRPSVESASTVVSTRYKREFEELGLIGKGQFGSVYRCVNRMDGRIYAIKRSKILAKGSSFRQRRASNEVLANAALDNHVNVVRYYSAWIEESRVSIQLEYCNGGDLAARIESLKRERRCLAEHEICRILIHLARGLRYIHGSKLAHMDIKPENVFISREQVWTTRSHCCELSDDFSKECRFQEEVVYKIGDLGHVTGIDGIGELEDEGDCRYLSKEVLGEDYRDVAKGDIFALALTIYDAMGGGPLPKNGAEWHRIRDIGPRRIETYSDELNRLVREMAQLDPARRPSAAELVQSEFLRIGTCMLFSN